MTDDAYDAQTLATSHRIERLHAMRFGAPLRTWTCQYGHVSRHTSMDKCVRWDCTRLRVWGLDKAPPAPPIIHGHQYYGLSDPEELIYSRAN